MLRAELQGLQRHSFIIKVIRQNNDWDVGRLHASAEKRVEPLTFRQEKIQKDDINPGCGQPPEACREAIDPSSLNALPSPSTKAVIS